MTMTRRPPPLATRLRCMALDPVSFSTDPDARVARFGAVADPDIPPAERLHPIETQAYLEFVMLVRQRDGDAAIRVGDEFRMRLEVVYAPR